jgi:hypothetical protein
MQEEFEDNKGAIRILISRLITGFVTRLTRRMSIVEQELPTLPEHPKSPPIFSGVRVTRSLVLYVYFGGDRKTFEVLIPT